MSMLRELRDRLPDGLVPRRAWPHRDGLAVEARESGGEVVAVIVTGDSVRILRGSDPALPALAPALATTGTVLLGHRPNRRAVMREPDGHYLKVVRPGRAGRVAEGLRRARTLLQDAAVVPAVCAQATDRVRLHPVPGPTLHDLLRTDPRGAATLCVGLGSALAAVQAADASGLVPHAVTDEIAVLRRWTADADRWAGSNLSALVEPVVAPLAALSVPRPVPCHRDLHDKQVIAHPTGAVGLLDLDTLCAADPALDIGNLLAHLRLRVLQGHCTPDAAARCADAVLDAMGVPAGPAVVAYRAEALLRLAAVYTFRPGPPGLSDGLAAAATDWSLG
jgi:aminoglycoside phosphotransferase (APT) family kinase protein